MFPHSEVQDMLKIASSLSNARRRLPVCVENINFLKFRLLQTLTDYKACAFSPCWHQHIKSDYKTFSQVEDIPNIPNQIRFVQDIILSLSHIYNSKDPI